MFISICTDAFVYSAPAKDLFEQLDVPTSFSLINIDATSHTMYVARSDDTSYGKQNIRLL